MRPWKHFVLLAVTGPVVFITLSSLFGVKAQLSLLLFTPRFMSSWNHSAQTTQLRNHYLKAVSSSSKCLTAALYSLSGGAGIGNVMFELLGFYAIAKKVGRVAVVYDDILNDKIGQVSEIFPNVVNFFREATTCGLPSSVTYSYKGCCKYDESIANTISLHVNLHSIKVELFYLQSFKFFNNLHPQVIRQFFATAPSIQRATSDLLFHHKPKKDALNICIHIRRGDFTNSSLHLATDKDFALFATHYVLAKAREEDSRQPYLYVMSDDSSWAEDNFRSFSRISIASNTIAPPCAEWEFSKLFCDRVLLTASVSTYGYWIGYLSRGQKVYYNCALTRKFEKIIEPADFWPSHWIAIQYQRHNQRITEWIPPDKVMNVSCAS